MFCVLHSTDKIHRGSDLKVTFWTVRIVFLFSDVVLAVVVAATIVTVVVIVIVEVRAAVTAAVNRNNISVSELFPQPAIILSHSLYQHLCSAFVMHVLNASAVSPFDLCNSTTSVWTLFCGAMYRSRTGTTIRCLPLAVSATIVRYLTLSSSFETVAWRQGPRHLLRQIHVLFDHMKTFPHAIAKSVSMYNSRIQRKGRVLFRGKQTVLFPLRHVYAFRQFVLQGKARRYFFIAPLSYYSNRAFFSWCGTVAVDTVTPTELSCTIP
jgi:hypothetical protein